MTKCFSPCVSVMCLLFYFDNPTALDPVSPHSNEAYHRYSHMGRTFLLMIPDVKMDGHLSQTRICFMTFEYLVKISVIVPDDLYRHETGYSEDIVYLKRERSDCKFLERNKGKPKYVDVLEQGHATRITAEYDIAVLVNTFIAFKEKEMFILPPTTAYSTRYLINLPDLKNSSYIGFMITLSTHDNTYVFITYKKQSSAFFFQSALTFTRIKWGIADVEQYYGALVESSKPLLLIAGIEQTLSFMIMPTESSQAKDFILMNISLQRAVLGNIKILIVPFNRKQTYELEFICCSRSKENVVLSSGNSHTFSISSTENTASYLHSTFSVTVIVYFKAYNLQHHHFGLVLLPERTWQSMVIFQKPVTYGAIQQNIFKIHMIVRKAKLGGLIYNGKAAAELKWKDYDRVSQNYTFYCGQILKNRTFIMQTDPRNNFAAYISVHSLYNGYSVATSLGQVYYQPSEPFDENRCIIQRTETRPGDDIDNDCDNRFDEEIWNGEDDDSDGLVDEDLMLERGNGSWGPWQPWHCEMKCNKIGTGTTGKVYWQRHRSCDDPLHVNGGFTCAGSNLEKTDVPSTVFCKASCNPNNTDDCPLGVFSAKCSVKCSEGCWMDVCHKDSGQCLACKSQYKNMPYCEHESYELNWTNPSGFNNTNATTPVTQVTPDANDEMLFLSITLIIHFIFIGGIGFSMGKKWCLSKKQDLSNEEQKEHSGGERRKGIDDVDGNYEEYSEEKNRRRKS